MAAAQRDHGLETAVFADREGAEAAIRGLLDGGVPSESITVVCSDEAKAKHFADYAPPHRVEDESAGGAAAGGAAGLILGGLVSLAGVATTGGLGIAAVGPLLGGGIAGTLLGALMARGVENEVARFYDQAVARGQILVAVHSDDSNAETIETARRAFRRAGALPFELPED